MIFQEKITSSRGEERAKTSSRDGGNASDVLVPYENLAERLGWVVQRECPVPHESPDLNIDDLNPDQLLQLTLYMGVSVAALKWGFGTASRVDGLARMVKVRMLATAAAYDTTEPTLKKSPDRRLVPNRILVDLRNEILAIAILTRPEDLVAVWGAAHVAGTVELLAQAGFRRVRVS